MPNYWKIYRRLMVGTAVIFIGTQWLGWTDQSGEEQFLTWWSGFIFTTVLCADIWVHIFLAERKRLRAFAKINAVKYKWWHSNDRIRREMIAHLHQEQDEIIENFLTQIAERNSNVTKIY